MQATRKDHDTEAARIADLCLGHLAEHPEELARFMQIAGYTPQSIRRALGSDELARGLIEHFAANETILLALRANAGLEPSAVMTVWHRLNPAQ